MERPGSWKSLNVTIHLRILPLHVFLDTIFSTLGQDQELGAGERWTGLRKVGLGSGLGLPALTARLERAAGSGVLTPG